MKKIIYLLSFLALLSCSHEPKPIQYGVDACDFCDMTIVDKAFSARAVSTKGKQFHYDAIECMVNDFLDDQTQMRVMQVANYENPGEMISAENASFHISDSIKSPMGANLAAFKKAPATQGSLEGEWLDWQTLKKVFLQKDSLRSTY